jgi:hypothetical protein
MMISFFFFLFSNAKASPHEDFVGQTQKHWLAGGKALKRNTPCSSNIQLPFSPSWPQLERKKG